MTASPFDGLADVFTGTLGGTVTLVNRFGVAGTATAIFVDADGDALDIVAPRPVLSLSAADAADLEAGRNSPTRVQVDGAWYRIHALTKDGRGMVQAELELDA